MAIHFSVESDGVTRTFTLERHVVTFGRSGTSTVCIDDPALSRTHCQLEVEEGACYVRDLNSRNGTMLRGERIGRTPIEPGATICIGTATIVFHRLAAADVAGVTETGTAKWTSTLFAGGRRRRRGGAAAAGAEKEVVRLQRLLAINRRIASELEPERVLTLILDSAVEFVDAERGFLVTVEQDRLYIPVARDFWRKDIPAPAFELSRSIALEVVRRGAPVLTDDASEDVRFEETVSVHDLKIRSVLCVPLKVRARTIGAIYLDNRFTRGTFTPADREAIEAFADQAAISLANSGRFAKTRDQGARWRELASTRECEVVTLRAQLDRAERSHGAYAAIVGRSESMRACLDLVDRVARTEIAVLVVGDSGVGKELIARAIHRSGPRCSRPFVTLDVASLAPGLVDVELFGHAAGAFTGAGEGRAGRFEEADGGTLFLDEVGDLSLDVQKRLLRVLETGEVRRVGGSGARKVDVRIVSSSNRDLAALVASGVLREDLFYRLKGVAIAVPPLRERVADIPLLTRHILESLLPLEEGGDEVLLEPAAMKALVSYPWPGNVRELENELRRLVAVSRPPFAASDLAPEIRAGTAVLPDRVPGGLRAHLEQIEREIIRRIVAVHGGNKTRAAEALGLSRLGLRKKMTRFGLDGSGPSA